MTRLDLLYRHCADEGIDVEWLDLGATRRGQYLDDERLIQLNTRLTFQQATSTLAHEWGHAYFRDRRSTRRIEARAWEFGAATIITPEEYRGAEFVYGHHTGALADALEVTPILIEAWRRWFAKRYPVQLERDVEPLA